MLRKILSLTLSISLLFQYSGFAQTINLADYLNRAPNTVALDRFRPLSLRYFSYEPSADNFKILLDKGDQKDISDIKIKDEADRLLTYFKIGLSLPNEKFWVNLRPDAEDQIIDPELEKTDLGKVLLEADLQLKKDTSSLTSPQSKEGKVYWEKLYKKAGELFGTENITIPTITRPWIVPGEIIVRESKDSAYIYKAGLKVMLEEDYLNNQKTEKPKNGKTDDYNFSDPRLKELNKYSTELIKETILPELTRRINSSKDYAALRQVYFSLILARWFKDAFGSFGSIRAPEHQSPENSYVKLIDSGDMTDLTSKESWSKTTYFNEYKKSFNDGEYNLSEKVHTPGGQVIRRYTSGGGKLIFGMKDPEVSRFMATGSPAVNNNMFQITTREGNFKVGSPIEKYRDDLKSILSELRDKGGLIPQYEYDGINNILNNPNTKQYLLFLVLNYLKDMREDMLPYFDKNEANPRAQLTPKLDEIYNLQEANNVFSPNERIKQAGQTVKEILDRNKAELNESYVQEAQTMIAGGDVALLFHTAAELRNVLNNMYVGMPEDRVIVTLIINDLKKLIYDEKAKKNSEAQAAAKSSSAAEASQEKKGPAIIPAVERLQAQLPDDVNEQVLKFFANVNTNGELKYPIKKNDSVMVGHVRRDRAGYLALGLQARGFENLLGYIKFNKDFRGLSILPEETVGKIENTFFERLAGYTSVRISENEKEEHVGFNANGRNENPLPGERRIVISMQKSSKAYVDTPEMRMREVADAVLDELEGSVDFILANLLSSDMLKHTGNFKAAKISNEITDQQLGRIKDKIDALKEEIIEKIKVQINGNFPAADGIIYLSRLLNTDYDKFLRVILEKNKEAYEVIKSLERQVPLFVITADHGASETGLKENPKESDTFHSANPVPYIIYDPLRKQKIPLKEGKTIRNNAATLLQLLGEEMPREYDESLLSADYQGSKRRIAFAVLDGWGINPDQSYPYDAIRLADTPNYDWLVKNASFTQLEARGEVIGLRKILSYEEGPHHLRGLQAGQTDVGHIHLFSGREVKQPLWYVDQLINGGLSNGVFDETKEEVKLLIRELSEVKEKGLKFHYISVGSEGGVHASLYHMYALMRLAKKVGLEKDQFIIHFGADGRDVPTRTAHLYLGDVYKRIEEIGIGVVSVVFGRDMLVRKKDAENITNRLIDVMSGENLKSGDVTLVEDSSEGKTITSSPILEKKKDKFKKLLAGILGVIGEAKPENFENADETSQEIRSVMQGMNSVSDLNGLREKVNTALAKMLSYKDAGRIDKEIWKLKEFYASLTEVVSMLNKLTAQDIVFKKGQKVFSREELNVSLNGKGISDDTRIKEALPNIEYLVSQGVKIVIGAHLGRPQEEIKEAAEKIIDEAEKKGQKVTKEQAKALAEYQIREKLSLDIVAERLQKLLGDKTKVHFNKSFLTAKDAQYFIDREMKNGDVLVLENVRFNKAEEIPASAEKKFKDDNIGLQDVEKAQKLNNEFAADLFYGMDVFVMNGFGVAHRKTVSVVGAPQNIPRAAGLLLKKEMEYLNIESLDVAIIGGSKVSDKIKVIENLLKKAKTILIGGAMTFAFEAAMSKKIGASMLKDRKKEIAIAKQLLEKAKDKIILPVDHKVAMRFSGDAAWKYVLSGQIESGWMGLDIGRDTINMYKEIIESAKTVLWNGPVGVFEFDNFSQGTRAIADAMAEVKIKGGRVVVGGGDSATAVVKLGMERDMSHVSTGGGAAIEYIEKNGNLPGILALSDKTLDEEINSAVSSSLETVEPTSVVGGIDLTQMNMLIQPQGSFASSSLDFSLPELNRAEIEAFDLAKELELIQRMASSGIDPIDERLKKYLAVCFARGKTGKEIDDLKLCLEDVFIAQQLDARKTPEGYKEVIVIADTRRYVVKESRLAARDGERINFN